MSKLSAEFYRVERTLSPQGSMPETRGKALRRILTGRAGNVTDAADVVRILDRSGRAVFERVWADRRAGALQEQEIVEDLLHLDVDAFRLKWAIRDPGAGPAGAPAPAPAPE